MVINDYLAVNRANWDERVEGHLTAYGADEFVADPSSISRIVRDDAQLMAPFLPVGSVSGMKLLHLQCHIGLDTLSWARLGAHVTGLDFSSEAVAAARKLAEAADLPAQFVESSVDDAVARVNDRFDIVYTSIGVLMWLPRLDSWAAAIHDLLVPGGIFFIREVHPVLSAVDYDRDDDELVIKGPYFPTSEPLRYDDGTTYADEKITLSNRTTFEWRHSVAEIINSLLQAGLFLTSFDEHRTIPWQALQTLIPTPEGHILPSRRDRLPLTFSLSARRPL
jgi:SAM-dependent methyltransferase